MRYRGGLCQRDRILDRISDPIFGSYPATLLWRRLGLGGRMCVWTLRDYSSSKPTSDPARSPTCVLSLKCLRKLPVRLEEQPLYNTGKGLAVSHRILFPPNKKYYKHQWVGGGLLHCFRYGLGWVPGSFWWALVGSAWVSLVCHAGSCWVPFLVAPCGFLSLSYAV